jgi:hypothetical protein
MRNELKFDKQSVWNAHMLFRKAAADRPGLTDRRSDGERTRRIQFAASKSQQTRLPQDVATLSVLQTTRS